VTSPSRTHYSQAFPKHMSHHPGMTLRDYFAAAALQGLCAGFSAHPNDDWPRDDEPEGYEVTAGHAYLLADAMLKARDA
jgi:hypothetical protein